MNRPYVGEHLYLGSHPVTVVAVGLPNYLGHGTDQALYVPGHVQVHSGHQGNLSDKQGNRIYQA